jgi:hypothetical protein
VIGAATFINPLLKVVTTVAILAAVYFLILRPILDTTNDTIDRAFEESAAIQKSVEQDVRRAQKQAQQQGVESFEIEAQGTSLKEAGRLLHCVRQAGDDVAKIQACNEIVAR